jgi:HEPN domain-containing protein
MTPKKITARDVPRGQYTSYLKKAREFFNAMESALSAGNWDAVGLNAAHCAISAADALLVRHAGKRSAGEAHHETAILLAQYITDDQISAKVQTYGRIISFKHLAAYEAREMTAAEAHEAAKITQRFIEWAQSLLKQA